VIGGGDTGSDCVGTSLPPRRRFGDPVRTDAAAAGAGNKALTWPYWPLKLRTSSSHEEGDTQRNFAIATKEFIGEKGVLKALKAVESSGRTAR
jgi:glutamate synthase (NADPH/NADH) small chain